jgi:lipopolysaccharide biosynthesis glycosyltransferase
MENSSGKRSRNLVFMVAVPFNRDLSYVQYARRTWESWCLRNDVTLQIWDQPIEDPALMKPNWQRYHLFDALDRQGLAFDRIAYVDCDTMIRWDCPNFFEFFDGNERSLGVVRDNSPRWMYESMKAHRRFFPQVALPWYNYFNSGFMVLNNNHRPFFQAIRDFYREHREELLEMENRGGLGTDQTPVNYLAKREGIELTYLPPTFNLLPLHSLIKGFLFVEMGYIWHFAGFSSEPRVRCMQATWETFAERYQAPLAAPELSAERRSVVPA